MSDKIFYTIITIVMLIAIFFTSLSIEKNDKTIEKLRFENHNLKMYAERDSIIINGLIEYKKTNYSLTKMSRNDLYERFKND